MKHTILCNGAVAAALIAATAFVTLFIASSPRDTSSEDSCFITPENVHLYANTNAHLLTGAPKAIVLEFPGLGGGSCLGGTVEIRPYDGEYARELAENDILIAYMFSGPWSWMQKGSVRYSDLVVDALMRKYGLGDDTPICVSGGSMGGHGAIIYAAESRHKDSIRAVAAACPCIDLTKAMFTDDTFPRSFVLGVADRDCSIEEGLRKASPANRIKDLSKVPCFIACDGADQFFDAAEMEAFAAELSKSGAEVTFRMMEGLTHGGFTPEVRSELTSFLISHCR